MVKQGHHHKITSSEKEKDENFIKWDNGETRTLLSNKFKLERKK